MMDSIPKTLMMLVIAAPLAVFTFTDERWPSHETQFEGRGRLRETLDEVNMRVLAVGTNRVAWIDPNLYTNESNAGWFKQRKTLVLAKQKLAAVRPYYLDSTMGSNGDYSTYLETAVTGVYPTAIPVLSETGWLARAGAPTNFLTVTPWFELNSSSNGYMFVRALTEQLKDTREDVTWSTGSTLGTFWGSAYGGESANESTDWSVTNLDTGAYGADDVVGLPAGGSILLKFWSWACDNFNAPVEPVRWVRRLWAVRAPQKPGTDSYDYSGYTYTQPFAVHESSDLTIANVSATTGWTDDPALMADVTSSRGPWLYLLAPVCEIEITNDLPTGYEYEYSSGKLFQQIRGDVSSWNAQDTGYGFTWPLYRDFVKYGLTAFGSIIDDGAYFIWGDLGGAFVQTNVVVAGNVMPVHLDTGSAVLPWRAVFSVFHWVLGSVYWHAKCRVTSPSITTVESLVVKSRRSAYGLTPQLWTGTNSVRYFYSLGFPYIGDGVSAMAANYDWTPPEGSDLNTNYYVLDYTNFTSSAVSTCSVFAVTNVPSGTIEEQKGFGLSNAWWVIHWFD